MLRATRRKSAAVKIFLRVERALLSATFDVDSKTRRIKINPKIEGKGSGQECPLYTYVRSHTDVVT